MPSSFFHSLLPTGFLCLCAAHAADATASAPAFWPSYLPPPAAAPVENDGSVLAAAPVPAVKCYYPQAVALIDNSDRAPYARFEWVADKNGALAVWGVERYPRDGVWQARWGAQPAYAPVVIPLPPGMADRLFKIIARETAAAKGTLGDGVGEAAYVFAVRAGDGALRIASTRGMGRDGTPACLREITVQLVQLLHDPQSPRAPDICARLEALLASLESNKKQP